MIHAIYRQKRDVLDVVQDAAVIQFVGHENPVIVPWCSVFDRRGSMDSMDALQATVNETLQCSEPLLEFRTEAGWLKPEARARVLRELSVRIREQGVVNTIALLGCVTEVSVDRFPACTFAAPSPANFGAPACFDLAFYLRVCTDAHAVSSIDGRVLVVGPLAVRLLRAAKRALRASAMATAVQDSS